MVEIEVLPGLTSLCRACLPVCRLVVQAALALRLLGAASLAGVAPQVLRAGVGVSCASFAFVLAASGKGRATPAAKKAA